jgi:tether containing UBX domain for GLUT4
VKTELKTEKPKAENIDLVEKVIEKELPKEDAILHYLDEDHQTVIYKLSDRSAKIRNIIDVSDDFFELTIEDAKSILRDARKAQRDADPEAGGKTLMTKAMRETQKEGKKLALLNKYKRAVVRVQLPDRHVIQAVFPPGADLIEVMENCKRYLNIQENLELFTTPPKTVLDLNQNLLDCDLVPAALIYLASKNSSSNISISNEVIEKLLNANGAENALSEAGVLKKTDFMDLKSESQHIVPSQSVSNSDSTSSSSASGASDAAMKRPPTSNLSGGKVPKWLKSSKQ